MTHRFVELLPFHFAVTDLFGKLMDTRVNLRDPLAVARPIHTTLKALLNHAVYDQHGSVALLGEAATIAMAVRP